MITVIEGVPGSGKSYYASHMIAKNHCTYDEFTESYQLKHNVALVTNVEGLKLNNMNLDFLIEQHGLERVFSIDFFKHLKEKFAHVVFVIDEAQRYFDNQVWSNIAFAFQYHRHLGVDMYVLTQDASLLPRGLVVLCEFIVRARAQSQRFGFLFVYDFLDTTKRMHLYSKHLKPHKNVFKLYKSYEFDEGEKPKNAIIHWVVIAVISFLVGFFGLKYTIFNLWGAPVAKVKGKSAETISSTPLPLGIDTVVNQAPQYQLTWDLVGTMGNRAIIKDLTTNHAGFYFSGQSLVYGATYPKVVFVGNCEVALELAPGAHQVLFCNKGYQPRKEEITNTSKQGGVS